MLVSTVSTESPRAGPLPRSARPARAVRSGPSPGPVICYFGRKRPYGGGYQSHIDGLRMLCGSYFLLSLPLAATRGPSTQEDPQKRMEYQMAITGTVKFFNADKGYGFIAPEDGTADAFVHISAVERAGMSTLNQNQRVSYELEADKKGKMAAVNLQSAD